MFYLISQKCIMPRSVPPRTYDFEELKRIFFGAGDTLTGQTIKIELYSDFAGEKTYIGTVLYSRLFRRAAQNWYGGMIMVDLGGGQILDVLFDTSNRTYNTSIRVHAAGEEMTMEGAGTENYYLMNSTAANFLLTIAAPLRTNPYSTRSRRTPRRRGTRTRSR